jgi:hypothetical protein
MQSSLITQPLIANHVRTMDMVMNQLADLMKIAWGDGKRVAHFMGEAGAKMMKVTSEIKNSDYAIYVKNTSKDKRDKEKIEALGQQVLSGAGAEGFLQMIKVMNSVNAKDAEVLLEQGLDAIRESQQAQQQQAMEMQQQASEAEQASKQAEMQLKQMDIDAKIKVAQIDAEAMIEATRMKIEGGQETQDFRQKHDLDMAMMNASNKIGEEKMRSDMAKNQGNKEESETKK